MYKAPGSATQLPVAEVGHSVGRSDGVTNSRDCTRVAVTGSLAIAGQFTVVHSYDVSLDFTSRGRTPHLWVLCTIPERWAGDAQALIDDKLT